MNRKTVLLAALLGCALASWTHGADARTGGQDGDVQSKWRETALCGLSMLLPSSMIHVTARQCTQAYLAWTE